MDVDEGSSVFTERMNSRTSGEMLFAKSDELTVSSYANLPVELGQVLKNAGNYHFIVEIRVQ
jgi:nuclear pore complex protein Nup133